MIFACAQRIGAKIGHARIVAVCSPCEVSHGNVVQVDKGLHTSCVKAVFHGVEVFAAIDGARLIELGFGFEVDVVQRDRERNCHVAVFVHGNTVAHAAFDIGIRILAVLLPFIVIVAEVESNGVVARIFCGDRKHRSRFVEFPNNCVGHSNFGHRTVGIISRDTRNGDPVRILQERIDRSRIADRDRKFFHGIIVHGGSRIADHGRRFDHPRRDLVHNVYVGTFRTRRKIAEIYDVEHIITCVGRRNRHIEDNAVLRHVGRVELTSDCVQYVCRFRVDFRVRLSEIICKIVALEHRSFDGNRFNGRLAVVNFVAYRNVHLDRVGISREFDYDLGFAVLKLIVGAVALFQRKRELVFADADKHTAVIIAAYDRKSKSIRFRFAFLHRAVGRGGIDRISTGQYGID